MNANTVTRIRATSDSFQVIANDRLAAEVTHRVHIGWNNGEPTYAEIMSPESADAIAHNVARQIEWALATDND